LVRIGGILRWKGWGWKGCLTRELPKFSPSIIPQLLGRKVRNFGGRAFRVLPLTQGIGFVPFTRGRGRKAFLT